MCKLEQKPYRKVVNFETNQLKKCGSICYSTVYTIVQYIIVSYTIVLYTIVLYTIIL